MFVHQSIRRSIPAAAAAVAVLVVTIYLSVCNGVVTVITAANLVNMRASDLLRESATNKYTYSYTFYIK